MGSFSSGNAGAFIDGSRGNAANAKPLNIKQTPFSVNTNKPVSFTETGFNTAEGYQQLQKGKPFTQSKGALPPSSSQPLQWKVPNNTGTSQPAPNQAATPQTPSYVKPSAGASATGSSSLALKGAPVAGAAGGGKITAAGAAAGKAAGLGVAGTTAAAAYAGYTGAMIGEGLRRAGLKNGVLNDNARYPKNTAELLRDPFSTVRDGARGTADTLKEQLTGLFFPEESEQSEGAAPSPQAAPESRQIRLEPTFTGGQDPNVIYDMWIYFPNRSTAEFPNLTRVIGYGPFSAPVITATPRSDGSFLLEITVQTGSGIRPVLLGGSQRRVVSEQGIESWTPVVRNIERQDGQPDTGGDPEGEAAPAPSPKRPSSPKFGPSGAIAPLPLPSSQGSPFSPTAPSPDGRPFADPDPPPPLPLILSPEPESESEPGVGPGEQPAPEESLDTSTPPRSLPNSNPFPRADGQPKKEKEKRKNQDGDGCRTKCAVKTQKKLDRANNNLANVQEQNNQILQQLNLLGQGADLSLLTVINSKLGPQVPGGISGFLGTMNEFIRKAWEFTKVDKALNALNTLLLLHNAAMLSRSLAQSLGELATQAISIFGVKDAEGNPIDVNEIVGGSITNIAKSVLGETLFTQVTESWAKANNILSSATQIVWTVRSLFDSSREITEWIAEHTGKIGNALKKWRVVGEDAYNWLPEKVTAQSRWEQRVNKFREGVEGLDDAASSLQGVLGEVQNIQQESQELAEQKQAFTDAIAAATSQERADNEPVKTAAEETTEASAAQDRAAGDRVRGDEL